MARILVAEDDPQVGHVLAERLQGDGHGVELAADAESALEQLKKRAVDLLLLDLRLPGKSGLDMFDEIRNTPEIDKDMKVVVLTNVDDPTVAKYVEARGGDFLVKASYSLDEIAAHVSKRLAEQ